MVHFLLCYGSVPLKTTNSRVTYFYNLLQESQLRKLSSRLYESTYPDVCERTTYAHINFDLLTQLGIDEYRFDCEETLAVLTGNHIEQKPISTVYAGHQFGVYTSRLGDGRVHILGDIAITDGSLWEIQLKGAGATPFARGNNGRMSLADAIVEYLGCEAMAGLGIPSTRGLALIDPINPAGSEVGRDREAIFVRTAETHLRFGHFEYLHNQADIRLLKDLADHVIESYYSELTAQDGDARYLQFLYAVTQRTARLVAQWQAVGFVHSVMNTDNMSIIGITMDYGVYGFMESYDSAYSPNEYDEQDRYAFNQQVDVARWNCLALAEALIELLPDKRIPSNLLRHYRKTNTESYHHLMTQKLALRESHPKDPQLISELLDLLQLHRVDYARFFRQLSRVETNGIDVMTVDSPGWQSAFQSWFEVYRQRLTLEHTSPEERQMMMLAHNPKFILRQHLINHVIQAADQDNNFKPLQELLMVLKTPYAEHDRFEHLA